jgi:hypothetical protein
VSHQQGRVVAGHVVQCHVESNAIIVVDELLHELAPEI